MGRGGGREAFGGLSEGHLPLAGDQRPRRRGVEEPAWLDGGWGGGGVALHPGHPRHLSSMTRGSGLSV